MRPSGAASSQRETSGAAGSQREAELVPLSDEQTQAVVDLVTLAKEEPPVVLPITESGEAHGKERLAGMLTGTEAPATAGIAGRPYRGRS